MKEVILWGENMDIKDMNINQLIKEINLGLKNNPTLSVNKLCDFLEIKQSTLKSKLSKEKYKFNPETRQYIKGDNSINKVVQAEPIEITSVEPNDDNSINEVIEVENKEIAINKKDTDKSMTLVIDDTVKSNLLGLVENYDKIMQMINQYNNKYDRKYDGLVIELPLETVKDFRTTIRVNNVIWERFKEFCNEHKEFTQRDLHSMALADFIEKHRK